MDAQARYDAAIDSVADGPVFGRQPVDTVASSQRKAHGAEAPAFTAEVIELAQALLPQQLPAATLLRLGELLYALGDLFLARACFEKALEATPHDCEAANNLGVLAFGFGRPADAREYFLTALTAAPNHAAALENLRNLFAVYPELTDDAALRDPRVGGPDGKIDVIVYQMAKVASTAVCNALQRRGVRAVKSHFLGDAMLGGRVGSLIQPGVDPYFQHHDAGQLVRNLGYTRELNWYKTYGADPGRRLCVITMARDPLEWQVSEFIQQHEGYRAGIEYWLASHGMRPAGLSVGDQCQKFFGAVVDRLLALPADLDSSALSESLSEMATHATGSDAVLLQHLRRFLRPVSWFQTAFNPVLEVDVFEHRFDARQRGLVLGNRFADILVLRYEDIGSWGQVIGDYLGLRALRLERENVSADKPHVAEISAAIRAVFTDALRQRIYATRYCRFFGYVNRTQ